VKGASLEWAFFYFQTLGLAAKARLVETLQLQSTSISGKKKFDNIDNMCLYSALLANSQHFIKARVFVPVKLFKSGII